MASALVIGIPFIVMGMIWGIVILTAVFCYCCYGGGGQWPEIYENNKRLGANQRYVIRFKFGKTKKEFDIKKSSIKVQIFTSKAKLISVFTIGPTLLRSAVEHDSSKEIKFILNRKIPLSKIIKVALNHNGKGAIYVNTLEIQKVNWDKANVAYINEYIEQLPEDEVKVKQNYPSATKEPRELENEAILSQYFNYFEYLAFIWMAMNLIPTISLFLILCNTSRDDSNETGLHVCKDYHDKLFSSVSTALMSGSLSTIIFVVLIVFYRFVVKTGVAKGSDFCAICKIVYIVVVVTIGAISGVFAAFDCAKELLKKKQESEELEFGLYWSLAVGIGITIFLMVWLPIMSVIAFFLGFFGRAILYGKPSEDIPDLSKSGTAESVKTKKTKDEDMKENQQLTAGMTKVKSVSKSPGTAVKPSKEKIAKPEPKTKVDDKKPTKTSSQESIGEGYYKQLMKGQTRVKSISQY